MTREEMTVVDLIAALELPEGSHINQRVPKRILLDNAAVTASDKRAINAGIEELRWVAALKPANIGVPLYRDAIREYLEIAVLQLILRPEARIQRLLELVHRAIPYPVLLFFELQTHHDQPGMSVVHKRWSQGEFGKMVLDGEITSVTWSPVIDGAFRPAFCAALALRLQSRTSLMAVYQGWMDSVFTLQASRRTGAFASAGTVDQAIARREALRECERLEAELTTLRAQVSRETQMNRRVDLNLRIRQLANELARSKEGLHLGAIEP